MTFRDPAEKDVLVLNYTMACPLRCDFCCYGCNPFRTEKMEIDKAKALIDEAAQISEISSVGFTGGEIFMHFDELLQLGEHLNSVGLKFTIATAAHWAVSYEKAFEMVSVLVALGLKRLNISHDYSHKKFVASAYIENAARSAVRLGIPVYIVGTFAEPDVQTKDLLPNIAEDPGIKFFTKRVSKVGRAAKQEVFYGDIDVSERPNSCYRREYHDIVVFYDGNVYPCCSTFNRSAAGLVVGNVYQESLRLIRQRIVGSLKIRTMKGRGFRDLYEIVRRIDPETHSMLPSPEDYPGACSLCSALFRRKDLTARIERAFEQYEDEVISASLTWLQTSSAKDKAAALLGSI